VGVKPIIKKINRYVLGGFKPSWDIESAQSHSGNEHVIKVNLQLEDEAPKQRISAGSKKKSRSSIVWWIVGVIIVLYLIFK
jgi:hypothetical protein